MHDTTRTANLLGATALAVAELALSGATQAVGLSASGAAALVVLAASPGLSVTELGKRIGLSQPAAARMIDTLEAGDLVERRPGLGCAVSVQLTSSGWDAGRRVLLARSRPLGDLVAVLDPEDQDVLAELLSKLLVKLYDDVGSSEIMCRLCDRASCTTNERCPVGQAERDRSR